MNSKLNNLKKRVDRLSDDSEEDGYITVIRVYMDEHDNVVSEREKMTIEEYQKRHPKDDMSKHITVNWEMDE